VAQLIEMLALRIYLSERERHEHKPLYEHLVLQARETGLAGAVVLRGHMGFGHSGQLMTTKILQLSEDLPVLIEIVDEAAKVEAFVDAIEGQLHGGLITVEKVMARRY
jgi:PII-like signaling protein